MTKKERRAMEAALRAAIEEAGGPKEVAEFISKRYEPITPQAVCGWDVCPWRRSNQVAEAARAKGGKTTAQQLRPDVFQLLAA